MAGYQQCIIVGNVGRDPNFKYTQGGVAVCDFSVAVTRRSGGGGQHEQGQQGQQQQREEKTTWFRVTVWRDQAEVANQYIKKGMQVMVVGTVEVNPYIDKNNAPAATLDLTAQTFQMLGSKGGGNEAPQRPSDQEPPQQRQQQPQNRSGNQPPQRPQQQAQQPQQQPLAPSQRPPVPKRHKQTQQASSPATTPPWEEDGTPL